MIQKENLEGSIAIRGLRVQAPPDPLAGYRSSSFVLKSSTMFVGIQLGYLTLFVMLDLDGFFQSLICLALLAC